MAALADDIAARPTLFEACKRAWRRAAAEWVDAEQLRTGGPVVFSCEYVDAATRPTLFEVCERAWRAACREWADFERARSR